MINYKKTYKESTSWRHWRLSCFSFLWYQMKNVHLEEDKEHSLDDQTCVQMFTLKVSQHQPQTELFWITVWCILCWNRILTNIITMTGTQFHTGQAVLSTRAWVSTTKIPLAASTKQILHHLGGWQSFIVHWDKLLPFSFPSIFQWGSQVRLSNVGGNPNPFLPGSPSDMLFQTLFTGWQLCQHTFSLGCKLCM